MFLTFIASKNLKLVWFVLHVNRETEMLNSYNLGIRLSSFGSPIAIELLENYVQKYCLSGY